MLLLALNVAGQPGEIRDVSLSMLGGFLTQAACEAAGQRLAMRAVGLVRRARMQQGIRGNSYKSTPTLNIECAQVSQ